MLKGRKIDPETLSLREGLLRGEAITPRLSLLGEKGKAPVPTGHKRSSWRRGVGGARVRSNLSTFQPERVPSSEGLFLWPQLVTFACK